jgi:hypothetical protein
MWWRGAELARGCSGLLCSREWPISASTWRGGGYGESFCGRAREPLLLNSGVNRWTLETPSTLPSAGDRRANSMGMLARLRGAVPDTSPSGECFELFPPTLDETESISGHPETPSSLSCSCRSDDLVAIGTFPDDFRQLFGRGGPQVGHRFPTSPKRAKSTASLPPAFAVASNQFRIGFARGRPASRRTMLHRHGARPARSCAVTR